MIRLGTDGRQHYICENCRYEMPYTITADRGKLKIVFSKLVEKHLKVMNDIQ